MSYKEASKVRPRHYKCTNTMNICDGPLWCVALVLAGSRTPLGVQTSFRTSNLKLHHNSNLTSMYKANKNENNSQLKITRMMFGI